MDYFFNFDKIAWLKKGRPEGCILCLVAAGSEEVERLVVAETEAFIAALNLYPYNPGHLLLLPKRHVTDIRQLEGSETLELDGLIRKALDSLDRILKPAGYNLGYNMGRPAGASIEHLHLHIIPRFLGELGIADLVAGRRVLVQDPRETQAELAKAFAETT